MRLLFAADDPGVQQRVGFETHEGGQFQQRIEVFDDFDIGIQPDAAVLPAITAAGRVDDERIFLFLVGLPRELDRVYVVVVFVPEHQLVVGQEFFHDSMHFRLSSGIGPRPNQQ